MHITYVKPVLAKDYRIVHFHLKMPVSIYIYHSCDVLFFSAQSFIQRQGSVYLTVQKLFFLLQYCTKGTVSSDFSEFLTCLV